MHAHAHYTIFRNSKRIEAIFPVISDFIIAMLREFSVQFVQFMTDEC